MSQSPQKPKIKSIVPTNFPLKVLKSGKRVVINREQTEIDNVSVISEKKLEKCDLDNQDEIKSLISSHTSTISRSTVISELKHLSESETLTDESLIDNSNKSLILERDEDISKIQECTDKLEQLSIETFPNKLDIPLKNFYDDKNDKFSDITINANKAKSNCYEEICIDSDSKSDIEIIKVVKKQPKNFLDTKSKINSTAKVNFKIENKNHKLNRNNSTFKENKENTSEKNKYKDVKNDVSNKTKALKDSTNPNHHGNKNVPVKKLATVNKKISGTQNKKFKTAVVQGIRSEPMPSQIKKSTVFNFMGKKSNNTVHRVTLNRECCTGNSCENCHPNKNNIKVRKSIVSQNLLSRPEYNSTICVMKKLKQVENEKIIPDFESLPPEYKNLIYGKVSSALDFAPYEKVYKDLVNLSVNVDNLPARLVRSKDPEPRDKDITPKLSDFYNPKCIEQYFVIATPITPSPENVNILSAFKINKKINTWKQSRDSFL